MRTVAATPVKPQETGLLNPAQRRAPIIEALTAYAGVTRFHMPGHRGGPGSEPLAMSLLGPQAFSNDVTGVLGLDDLHEPHGCILDRKSVV